MTYLRCQFVIFLNTSADFDVRKKSPPVSEGLYKHDNLFSYP